MDATKFQIRGRSLIAGVVSEGSGAGGEGGGPLLPPDRKFYAVDPQTGRELPTLFLAASQQDVDRAAWSAWDASHSMMERPAGGGGDRAALLETIAARIMDLGDELLGVASDETGLGPARLVSERERTVTTLRMFADVARRGEWVEATIDTGQASRRPMPKPDVRRMLRPLGPVAVFGAGNFPLAYSTAGGDTASALAAGCPVIVKGHPGHPGTGELVAQAIAAAVRECGFHPGTFSYLHAGGQHELAIGQRLVQHPAVRAVGFTGSLSGGMALDRLARERRDPIPVFAEMGSTNPVFVLPGALKEQADLIAERLAGSATASGGQMCTCPGLVFGIKGGALEPLLSAMSKGFDGAPPVTMLNPRTRQNYVRRMMAVGGSPGVALRAGACGDGMDPRSDASLDSGPVRSTSALFSTSFDVFRRDEGLRDEVFGPATLFVKCESEQQMLEAAASVQGSLTATIWASGDDARLARRLHQILEQRVGRLIYNGVPTGVEVCNAMVHGGPYPATNQQHTTAVGMYAIKRWARPVCYQNAPDGLLPPELRNGNPLKVRRLVDGEWEGGTEIAR
jgi:2,5-dioxopentanoate dehydrogenase